MSWILLVGFAHSSRPFSTLVPPPWLQDTSSWCASVMAGGASQPTAVQPLSRTPIATRWCSEWKCRLRPTSSGNARAAQHHRDHTCLARQPSGLTSADPTSGAQATLPSTRPAGSRAPSSPRPWPALPPEGPRGLAATPRCGPGRPDPCRACPPSRALGSTVRPFASFVSFVRRCDRRELLAQHGSVQRRDREAPVAGARARRRRASARPFARASASSASSRRASSASAAAGSITSSTRRPRTRSAFASCSAACSSRNRVAAARHPRLDVGRQRVDRVDDHPRLVGAQVTASQRGRHVLVPLQRGREMRRPVRLRTRRTRLRSPTSSPCVAPDVRARPHRSAPAAAPASAARRAGSAPASAAPAHRPHRPPTSTTAARRDTSPSSSRTAPRQGGDPVLLGVLEG